MSTDLTDLITKTLGVVPTPAVAVPKAKAKVKYSSEEYAPARPLELYEYRVEYVRSQYSLITVQASSADEASEIASGMDIDVEDVGYGDWDESNVEKESSYCVNEEEIEEWDDLYGDKYDTDGSPKCTECGDNYAKSDLFESEDGSAWYCEDCRPDDDDDDKSLVPG